MSKEEICDYRKLARDIYLKNDEFLNKYMILFPQILLTIIIFNVKAKYCWELILLFILILSSGISVILGLISFKYGKDAAELYDSQKFDLFDIYNRKTLNTNLLTWVFNIISFIVFLIIITTQITGAYTMNKQNVNDGLTIPKSERLERTQKGITLPERASSVTPRQEEKPKENRAQEGNSSNNSDQSNS